jgi:hypothetical protein
MEPKEVASSGGDKVAEADFIIEEITDPDGTTPTYDTVLDTLMEHLAVSNSGGFTITLHADLKLTTEIGGDA